jgi:hypothetical protein
MSIEPCAAIATSINSVKAFASLRVRELRKANKSLGKESECRFAAALRPSSPTLVTPKALPMNAQLIIQ